MISLFNSIGLGPSPTRLERTVATTAFYTRLAANWLSSAVTRGSPFLCGLATVQEFASCRMALGQVLISVLTFAFWITP